MKHQCIDAEYEQSKVRNDKDDSKLTFQDFCKCLTKVICSILLTQWFYKKKCILLLVTPKAKRSIFVVFVSLTISFLSCATVILSYITTIFEQTGSPLSSKYSSFLISVVQLFANVIFLNIVERFNRMVCNFECFDFSHFLI